MVDAESRSLRDAYAAVKSAFDALVAAYPTGYAALMLPEKVGPFLKLAAKNITGYPDATALIGFLKTFAARTPSDFFATK